MPAALLALLCAACNGRTDKVKPEATTSSGAAMKADSSQVAGVALEEPKVLADEEQKEETPAPDWDRRIIKTADLTLKVKNFQYFTNRLHSAVRQSGGYIAQEQQSQSAGEIENIVTIKVPVDHFELLMGEMPGDSDKLEEKKISSEDVTMELVDTKSHLQTKKQVREQYRELLKQAHSMKDIIAIQNEIDDIQQEMDEAAGRVAYLDHSSAYSTINLRFYQVLDAAAHEETEPSLVHRLAASIGEGWKSLSTFLLELISIWPLWIVLVFGIFRIRKWRSRVKTQTVRPVQTAASGGSPEA